MSQFQIDYTTTIETFEDFILTVFVIIDDLYQQYAPASVSLRPNVKDAKLSDSEIITIGICGVILAYNLCLAVNYLFDKTCDFRKIKHLIFLTMK